MADIQGIERSPVQSGLLRTTFRAAETHPDNRTSTHRPIPIKIQPTADDERATVAVFNDEKNNRTHNRNHDVQKPTPSDKKTVIAIVTQGRTGSTFTGEILNSHPDVFYVDEPLHVYDGSSRIPRKEIVGEQRITAALETSIKQTILENVFTCRYDGQYMQEFIKYNKNKKMTRNFARTRALLEMVGCTTFTNDEVRLLSCPIDQLTENYLRHACSTYKFLAAKILRANIYQLQPFLNSPHLNLKIIYLIRDPRGVLNSQLGTGWFTTNNQDQQLASSAKTTCNSMLDGLEQGKELPADRFMVLKYEDMAMKPFKKTDDILRFSGLNMTDTVMKHITSHTRGKHNSYRQHDWFSYRSNSTATALAWRTTFPQNYRMIVENTSSCRRIINQMGYDEL